MAAPQGGAEAYVALGTVQGGIRELTAQSLESCFRVLQAELSVIAASEDALRRLVSELVNRAVTCAEASTSVAHLCGRFEAEKRFKTTLLSHCQQTFNTLCTSPWAPAACVGLGSFFGALHAENLIPNQIAQTCIICSLCGTGVERTHVPSSAAMTFACTLYISIEQGRGYTATFGSKKTHWLHKRFVDLRANADAPTRVRISHALSIGKAIESQGKPDAGSPLAPAAAVSPASRASGSFRHDPYAEVPLAEAAAAAAMSPTYHASPTGAATPAYPVSSTPTFDAHLQQSFDQPPAQQQQPPPQPMGYPQQQQQQQPQQPLQQQQQQQQQPYQQPMQPVAFAAQQQPLQPGGSAPAEPQPLTRANLEEWVSLTAPMAHGAAGYNQLQQQLQLQQQQQQQQHLAPHPVQLQQQQQQQHHQAWVQSLTPVVLQQQGGAPPPRRAQRAAPQPFNLPQLLQEAAIYKTQAAAEAAITQYNVTVPQSPYPQQLQLQQPQQQLQRSPVYHTSPGVSPYRGGAVPQQQQQQQQQQPQQPLPNQGHALHQPQFPHQTPYQSQQAPSPPPGPPSPPSPPRHQSSPTEPQRPANRVAGGAPPGAKPLAAGAAAQKQQQGGAEPSPAAARWCDDDALPGDAADLSPPKKPATNIFDACATRREKRRLGNLIINKALQEGYNRSYGAARRKVARFCRMHGIGEADQSVLVEFLNDLFLAGKQYRGLCLKEFVDAPSRLLEEGLKKKARAPGGMRTKQRKRIFEDDEIESVMSFNTNCTDTWHEAISDDELEELAGWYEDTATLGTRRSSCRSLKLDPSSCRASSAASSCDHGDQEHLTTPPAAALDIDPTTPSGHNGSVCSRRSSRSIGSRTSRASRASSKAGLKYSQLPDDLTLDDRVKVKRADGKEHEGTVRYIGFPQFADKGDTYDGCWVGVALDHAVGNHDGTVDNERYFIAKPQHGVFVRDDKILRTPDKIEGGVFFYPQHRTNRLLRFDVRQEALRPYGFKSGDVIAATHSKYKGQGKAGVVIGVRHGLLYWKIEGEGVTGACACRNTQEETIETFKKKKYKKIGSESLRNYFSEITPEDANAAGDMGKGISDAAMEKVSHIVDPDNEKWEGALVSPTPAEGYQSWMKRLWRKKKVEQVENSKAS